MQTENSIILNALEFQKLLQDKALALDLKYSFEENDMLIEGDPHNMMRITEYSQGLKDAKQLFDNKIIEENFLETSLELHEIFSHHLFDQDEIEIQAKKLNIMVERNKINQSLKILASLSQSFEFVKWLYSTTITNLATQKLLQENIEIEQGVNWNQADLFISPFHRRNKNDILEKSLGLGIDSEFGRDVLLATGDINRINDLKAYLYDIESHGKRTLYPKYWDFYESSYFTEIDIPENSEEFNHVAKEFYASMEDFKIVRVKRIQNKDLMDNYISTLQKRQEARDDFIMMNRKLLFHGTKNIDPKTIYLNSNVGFDMRFSKKGTYGKGIYFAKKAKYCHEKKFSYDNEDGTYRLFLADVFVGNAYTSLHDGSLIKEPENYDCVVNTKGEIFVVYHNSQSYPLYIIDYEMKSILDDTFFETEIMESNNAVVNEAGN